MNVNELKTRVENEFRIPADSQKVVINDVLVEDGEKLLEEFDKINENEINVKVTASKRLVKQDSASDDETQNEKVAPVEGAVGGSPAPTKLKIEEDGWECPLCTLINTPNRPGCLACSTTRPLSYVVPSHLKDIEYKLKVNEDLRTFFEMDKVEVRPQSQKNDLNRQSSNRKSSDIFNILGEEKKPEELQSSLAISSPNITKNKYRGVDNFNPTSYVFPKMPDIRKPVITSVIYKASPVTAKDPKTNLNHYQELVSFDLSDLAPNLEKFECSICFLEIEPRAGAVLRECLHSFCKSCLASHIKHSEEAEVKCPFMDNQYSCQSLLQEREIRGLVTPEEYDKHLTRSIRQAEHKIENTFHCKTPNCRGWCIFEDTLNSFKCPVCTILNCLTCRVSWPDYASNQKYQKYQVDLPQAIHDGINCKQYQDQLNSDGDSESAKQTKELLQEMIDKGEALNCPTCHVSFFVSKRPSTNEFSSLDFSPQKVGM